MRTALEFEIKILLVQAETYNLEARMHQRDDHAFDQYMRHSIDMSEQKTREAEKVLAKLKELL